MIILYEYTETAFTNNGLGCLNDATSCSVKETLNGEYELEMEYPVNGIHYSDIQLRRIILAKPNSYDQTQPFRIYSISKPIGGLVTVNAEHISYDMSGLPVRGALEHYAWYVKDVFDHIKNNSVYHCPFTFSSDITEEKKSINLSKPRSVKAFLGTDEGLLSLFGGEWEFDRYKAILHKERGQNRGVSIEYGKNLTDVTQDEACSEMYTAVYPYYYQEDDGLQRLDDDVVKILDTPYKNVYVLDLTSEFDEMPTQDQLRAKTQEYIKENKLDEPKVSLKVSFIQNPEVIEALQDVRLGDTGGVKFIKIGVDTTSRCISYEFNVLTEQYNSIELGEPTKTIVDTMTSTNSRIDAANSAIDDTQDNLDDEIDRATDAEGVLSTRIDKTDSDITLEVTRAQGAEESLGSRITLTEESIEAEVTRAQGAENSLGSRITQTAESIEAEVYQRQANDLDLSTRISQTPHKIDLTASGGDQSVGITIRLYDENGNLVDTSSGEANITVTGFVTFYDLANAGSTTINGANITTGTISCDMLKGGTINGQKIVLDDGWTLLKDTAGNSIFDILGLWKKTNSIPTSANSNDWFGEQRFQSKITLNGDISANGIKGRSSSASANVRCQDGTNAWLAIAATSSQRYKHDIADITDPKLDPHHLLRLHARQYKYNLDYLDPEDARYDEVVCGFIAEEVENIYPVACEYNSDGLPEKWDVRYVILPMLLLIQEQHEEIEQLKSDNFALKGEVDILKQRLGKMEEMLNVINSKIN